PKLKQKGINKFLKVGAVLAILLLAEVTAAQNIIWQDDFEGTQEPWTPSSIYTFYISGGPTVRPLNNSRWRLVNTISQTPPSPSHAWHIGDGEDVGGDKIISPVIHLPTTVDGQTLEKALVSLWVDINAPSIFGDAPAYYVSAGLAEAQWAFDTSAPVSPPSHWALRQPPAPVGGNNVQAIISPELDLSAVTAPLDLSFVHQYVTENNFDYCFVDISTDNFVTYKVVANFEGFQPDYVQETINLNTRIGQTIKIRFRYATDPGVTRDDAHWFIDDILLQDANGTLFSDNGGDNGTTTMTKWGFVGSRDFIGRDRDNDRNNPAVIWEKKDAANMEGGSMDILTSAAGVMPGDSVRIAIGWVVPSDEIGGYVSGRGLFIDDVTVEPFPMVSSIEESPGKNIPTEYSLSNNYPNPFNPETRIRYELPQPDRVLLKVINLLGQEVRTLVDEDKPAGFYEVMWDGKDNHGQRVASGVYLYRLETKEFVQNRKMLLLQ
ncbi:MAG: FlgD immunoglobulin-like domain containing protein, partial [bacterium]